MARIVALVLAAGRASRFGGARSKVLASLKGETMVRQVCRSALEAGLPAVVVGGYQAELVRAEVADLPVSFVENPHFAEGMSTSLQAGLRAAGEADGVLVMLADMPQIKAASLLALRAAFEQNSGALAVIPTYRGERGNPVLLGRAVFDKIRTLQGDQGARRLLQVGDGLVEVALDDPAILVDIDTKAALETLERK